MLRRIRNHTYKGESTVRNEKNNLGLFAAMLTALGGVFAPVVYERSPEQQRRYDERKANRWSFNWFRRPADLTGYQQVHGTLYRRKPKTSKRERRIAAFIAAGLSPANAVRALHKRTPSNQVRQAFALAPRGVR
jgi:hypothetical protein